MIVALRLLAGVAEAAFFVAGFAALADLAPPARLGEALSYNSPGLYLGIALAQWVEYYRVVRARSALVLGSPAVEAARLLRLGPLHVVRHHLGPELRPLLGTLASLGMVTSVLAMSTLGFVKVGLQPPRAELGLMITDAFPFADVAPWLALAPIAVLFVLTVCFLTLRAPEDER